MPEWSKEFPTEPGYYWFFGDNLSNKPRVKDIKMRLVTMNFSGLPECEGNFMSESTSIGLWLKLDAPSMPPKDLFLAVFEDKIVDHPAKEK